MSDMDILSNDEVSDEPVETAMAALSAGWASLEEVADAVAARRTQHPLIGELLLKGRKITVQQVFAVLAEKATSNKLFGQIAVDMGFITVSEVGEVLYQQALLCPPLWQVLESRGVITSLQAESIQAITRADLR